MNFTLVTNRRRPRLTFAVGLLFATAFCAAAEPREVTLAAPPTLGRPATHGIEQLRAALANGGWTIATSDKMESGAAGPLIMIGVVPRDAAAATALRDAGGSVAAEPESLAVRKTKINGRAALILCGRDERGLMYALLDTADRIRGSRSGEDPFAEIADAAESPFVRDRSLSVYTMNRAHWESRFYDERYWTRYFDLLAANRFNRFLIVFGYENGGFLAPPYPYFFDTPGFPQVKMVDLTAAQQRRNLDALNRLIELAHDRGIAVSLGIWDHIYRGAVQTGGAEWLKAYAGRPVPNTVTGVTTENLNAYTLASLKELLVRVPAVDALQFRVHEESGLKRSEMEGFWREVFRHVQKQRPGLLLEARAKGTPDAILDTALAQGVNLRVETKYWMEQMGLPFHPTHVNPPNQRDRRHGYADLLRYPQRFELTWRLWNGGTSRLLLWGDPDYVRRYSQSTLLYDSRNWDVQEPLATKMEAQRPDMPTFALMPEKYRHYDYEFERYWHFYQVWGRVGYNADASPELWQREFRRRFGDAAAPHVERALHRASAVLPMIVAAVYPYRLFPTTRGWAERQSLGANLADYAKNEGTDTEQFESFAEAAKRIVAGGFTAKRTPDATSRWFNETADAILSAVQSAEAAVGSQRSREFDATMTDARILAQLARFHARRALAAVHYNLFLRSLSLPELVAATYGERDAVAAWRELVAAAGDRYNYDLAMGARNYDLCGHWRDELLKLETGLKELEAQCCPPDEAVLKAKVWTPSTDGDREPPTIEHDRIRTAQPNEPLTIMARVTDPAGVKSVRLRYRHVTQFEDYATLDMQPTSTAGTFAATVPADFLTASWDFMYFIEAIDGRGNGRNWPDLAREMPYVIVKVRR